MLQRIDQLLELCLRAGEVGDGVENDSSSTLQQER